MQRAGVAGRVVIDEQHRDVHHHVAVAAPGAHREEQHRASQRIDDELGGPGLHVEDAAEDLDLVEGKLPAERGVVAERRTGSTIVSVAVCLSPAMAYCCEGCGEVPPLPVPPPLPFGASVGCGGCGGPGGGCGPGGGGAGVGDGCGSTNWRHVIWSSTARCPNG